MKFGSIETGDEVMQQGFNQFDKKPFIVTPWHENFQKEKVEQVPVWVQFPKLDLKYWSLISLSKLASLLGILIMADKNTVEKNMVNYATLLIEISILKKLPKYIHFENEKHIIHQQEIVFEWERIFCDQCKKIWA